MYGVGRFHHRLDRLFKRLPFTIQNVLARELHPNDEVLDIGCGPNSPLALHEVKYSVGVEVWEPYVAKAKETRTHDEVLVLDCLKADFDVESFDVVLALDVIEHIDKAQGRELIERMKRWARKKVILTVPNGYTPGHLANGNPFQRHWAAWTVAELKALGFRVRGIGIKLPSYGSTHPLLFFLMRYGTYPLRVLTWRFPFLAYDLVGVYHKD